MKSTIMTTKPAFKQGKVRDIYDDGHDHLLLVSTDRTSAFDQHICEIPHKGEVLATLSAWWFTKTQHIIANHLVAQTAADTLKVKKTRVLPVEVVVRGYLTGSTSTSILPRYLVGERHFFDSVLPDGLLPHHALPQPILTPSTKSTQHDENLTPTALTSLKGITAAQWQFVADKAMQLYQFGHDLALSKGWILADTKYEFGQLPSGEVILIDEIHTPDSSRYWQKQEYARALQQHKVPEPYDKELLRRWLKTQGDPYTWSIVPAVPDELLQCLSARYQEILKSLRNRS